MGTRSVTTVYEYGTPIVSMYRQYDGYPSGHGIELAEFLCSRRIVNGLGKGDIQVFNGIQCLAAMMVAHFKGDKPGGFYLVPPGQSEEYNYHVTLESDGLHVKVNEDDKTVVFDGTLEEFVTFIKDQ